MTAFAYVPSSREVTFFEWVAVPYDDNDDNFEREEKEEKRPVKSDLDRRLPRLKKMPSCRHVWR
jgi:hypothetical protein